MLTYAVGRSLMPEGHTIHRLALDLTKDLAGERVAASSPQGRFVGLSTIAGKRFTRAHAVGKHLFLDFGARRVHVHLGLFGKFKRRRKGEPPRASVRLRLETPSATWDLTGPTKCALIDDDELASLRARLGADPLAVGARSTTAWKRISTSDRAIGALLLDQSVIAGIGNVYRAEILFLAGVNPLTSGRDLSRPQFDRLWRLSKDLLRAGVEANRIVTVAPAERTPGRGGRREQLHVYKHATCRRCTGSIGAILVAARTLYYCPKCQPLEASR